MSSRTRNLIIGAVVVVVVAIIGIFSFGTFGKKNNASSSKTVTIGVMTGTSQDDAIWKVVEANASKDYGITIKLTHFTDYTQPNAALSNGSVDLNAFQHYAFLNAWNKAHHTNIVAIGDTWITPIHLYSKKYTSVSQIPDGATIAVPNDASNESRALYVLEGAGLIKLSVSGDTLATLSDVTYVKQIKILELDASQTARSLDSTAAAVINSNYAQTAGLTLKSAIFAEPLDANSHQWINFIAANSKDKNNAVYQDIVKSLQKPNVEAEIKAQYTDGSEIAAWNLKLK